MARYLIFGSCDPLEANDTARCYDVAASLAKEGHSVTFFLVQNGVFPARRNARSRALAALTGANVTVLADEFSLRERGITTDRMAAGVKAAPLDVVIDHLAEGAKTFWH